jgi:hypothetical protein
MLARGFGAFQLNVVALPATNLYFVFAQGPGLPGILTLDLA